MSPPSIISFEKKQYIEIFKIIFFHIYTKSLFIIFYPLLPPPQIMKKLSVWIRNRLISAGLELVLMKIMYKIVSQTIFHQYYNKDHKIINSFVIKMVLNL